MRRSPQSSSSSASLIISKEDDTLSRHERRTYKLIHPYTSLCRGRRGTLFAPDPDQHQEKRETRLKKEKQTLFLNNTSKEASSFVLSVSFINFFITSLYSLFLLCFWSSLSLQYLCLENLLLFILRKTGLVQLTCYCKALTSLCICCTQLEARVYTIILFLLFWRKEGTPKEKNLSLSSLSFFTRSPVFLSGGPSMKEEQKHERK